jgi:lipoate-protein ligase B
VRRLVTLGRKPYRETLALMRELHARVARGTDPDTWIVVEHDPVVTLGRNAKATSLRLSPQQLAERDVDFFAVERGGDATFHGPGQVVVYPIVRLARFREVVPFVGALERSAVAALASFGIAGHPRPEHRGVYVGDAAICAVGLSVKAMTTLHGLALNVCTQLDYDRLIDPCGTPQFGITSISRELGRPVSWEQGCAAILAAVEAEFSFEFGREAATR